MDIEFLETVVWPRLDRYKAAVIAKQDADVLDILRLELLREIIAAEGDFNEVMPYLESQCEQIEQRYLTPEETIAMKRGPHRVKQ